MHFGRFKCWISHMIIFATIMWHLQMTENWGIKLETVGNKIQQHSRGNICKTALRIIRYWCTKWKHLLTPWFSHSVHSFCKRMKCLCVAKENTHENVHSSTADYRKIWKQPSVRTQKRLMSSDMFYNKLQQHKNLGKQPWELRVTITLNFVILCL